MALAAIGVVLPGVPTTGFLILASACFTKSSPWLEQKLIRNRFFGPFLIYLKPDAPIPARARVAASTLMWIAILLSSWTIYQRNERPWLPGLLIALGAAGTVTIWRFRRTPLPAPRDAAG